MCVVSVSVLVGGNLENLPLLVVASTSGREQYINQKKSDMSTSMLRVYITGKLTSELWDSATTAINLAQTVNPSLKNN